MRDGPTLALGSTRRGTSTPHARPIDSCTRGALSADAPKATFGHEQVELDAGRTAVEGRVGAGVAAGWIADGSTRTTLMALDAALEALGDIDPA